MGLFKKKEKYEPISGIIDDAVDYRIYIPSQKEKILWFVIGMIVGGAVLYIFYEQIIISIIAGVACGFCFIPIRTGQVIAKRKQKLSLQFRELLDTLATSIGAGKNMFDAFNGAADDLAIQFTEDSDIVREIKIICAGLNSNIQIEDLLMNFAQRTGLDDVENFANVFSTCYRKGGNIKEVIKNTATIISDKIEVKMELETMVAGQKNELSILLVMPVLFVIIMKSMGGGLIDLSTPVGMLSVTIAIVIFVVAYFIGKKITDIKL